jgi:hypothetical protein
MLCILYVITVTTLLGVVGILFERVLPAAFPRRWMWCVLIVASVALPGYNRYHRTLSVTSVLEQQSSQPVLTSVPGIASLPMLDPAWWAKAESYDTMINPFWIAASSLLFAWGLANVLRVAWLVHKSRKARGQPGKPGLVDGVPVVVTDSIGPATVGLLRSSVLLPRWVLALPAVQRRYVVCHEDQHRRAHDAHVLFAASLTLILMPWNVALWWLIQRLSLAVELDCDNRVVSKLGNPNAYGELLLKVAEAANRGPRLQPALLGTGMLERRLTVLLAPTPLRHIQKFLLPAAAIALLMLVLSAPHPVLGHSSHSHSAMTPSR